MSARNYVLYGYLVIYVLLSAGCIPPAPPPPVPIDPFSNFSTSSYDPCSLPVQQWEKERGQVCLEKIQLLCQKLFDVEVTELGGLIQQSLAEAPNCERLRWLEIEFYLRRDESITAMSKIRAIDTDSVLLPEFQSFLGQKEQQIKTEWLLSIKQYIDSGKAGLGLELLQFYKKYWDLDRETICLEIKALHILKRYDAIIEKAQAYPEEFRADETLDTLIDSFLLTSNSRKALSFLKTQLEKQFDDSLYLKYEQLRKEIIDSQLPQDVKNLVNQPWISNEEFAALVDARFGFTDTRPEYPDPIILDVENSFARDAIVRLVKAGVMNVRRNHRFNPQVKIRRMDLAMYLTNLAELFQLDTNVSLETLPEDISLRHYASYAIAFCLSMNLLTPEADGQFRAGLYATGAEISRALDMLDSFVEARSFHPGSSEHQESP